MPAIDFIFDNDCPNVAPARANLLRAFAATGLPAKWSEWERSSPGIPADFRQFGSPAILINGRDLTGMAPGLASACRLYQASDGAWAGVPPVEMIAEALRGSNRQPAPPFQVKQQWPLVPAVLFALLPKVACPACWPAYAGLLSALGVGFLATATYLLPLTAVFLAAVLASLAFRARSRWGWKPFLLGLAGSAALLIGKFGLESNPLFYAGLAALVASSIWNTWPRKQSKTAPCCTGTPGGARITAGVPRS